MEIALYHKVGGYYESHDRVGPEGDYYTSPITHPSFGGLLAIQLQVMWDILRRPTVFWAVELGAGTGVLSRDIERYSHSLEPQFCESLRYVAVDRTSHITWESASREINHLTSSGMPFGKVVGCVLSNELVDSFPIHRFQAVGKNIKEVYVTIADDEFQEELGSPSTLFLENQSQRLDLSDMERGELNLEAAHWISDVGLALDRGFVLTIDYGYESMSSDRPRGNPNNMMYYYKHVAGISPYERVGSQDITSMVNFSTLIEDGLKAGLEPVGICSQRNLLNRLGFHEWLQELRAANLTQTVRDANIMGMRELVNPNSLGGFKVLIQHKETDVNCMTDLIPAGQPVRNLPLPLMDLNYISLINGKYPHLSWDWESQWSQDSDNDFAELT